MEDILLTPMKVNSEIICVGISKCNKDYAGKHNDVDKMSNVQATERNKKYLKQVVLKYKISPVHNTFKSLHLMRRDRVLLATVTKNFENSLTKSCRRRKLVDEEAISHASGHLYTDP